MLTSYLDGQTFGRKVGEGQPKVLALHGWNRDSSDFTEMFKHVDGLAVDLAGFGQAPVPPHVWGAHDYADWLAPLLEECSTEVVLVGHSLGGRVAACLAAKYPGTIKSVVLCGAPIVRNPSRERIPTPFRYKWSKKMHQLGFVSDKSLEKQRMKYGSADYRQAQGIMRSVLIKLVNESYEHDLSQIKASTYLVWGAADFEVPWNVATHAKGFLQDAQCHTIPNVGHQVPIEAPEELAKIVRSCLV